MLKYVQWKTGLDGKKYDPMGLESGFFPDFRRLKVFEVQVTGASDDCWIWCEDTGPDAPTALIVTGHPDRTEIKGDALYKTFDEAQVALDDFMLMKIRNMKKRITRMKNNLAKRGKTNVKP